MLAMVTISFSSRGSARLQVAGVGAKPNAGTSVGSMNTVMRLIRSPIRVRT
jgi:hypothetical protein